MKFNPTPLHGAYTIQSEPIADDRGFFARQFCAREFEAAGLEWRFLQSNNTLTTKKGTVRGFHYQLPPSAEVKLVRCVRGAVWDAIVDIRPDSPTFRQWFGARLDQDNRLMMYVPRGFAHGFVSMTDNAELIYMVSAAYDRTQERGLRWNDRALNVEWPLEMKEISAKDAAWPDFDEVYHGTGQMRNLG
jgi:dTDP-4-dehydrorhamnose 3,5-epimerase